MSARLGIRIAPITALLVFASLAHGATVSYPANLHTSKGNPVYDILILETDGTQQVHATIYPVELPGTGLSVISHDVPFTPVKTLIIGLTEGTDDAGNDHTQIVMFLDNAFAAAHAGVPFSSIFPGTRHSTTIANLQAAVAGDAAQLAWFTDTFFSGPAAGAAFDSRGSFTVAEFTSLTIMGASAAAGNWMITNSQTIPCTTNCNQTPATEVLNETAKIDTGPFDIAFELSKLVTGMPRAGDLVVDKTVVNNTGVAWSKFEMLLGTGSGPGFVPSTMGDGLSFIATSNNHETTGAFPNVVVQEDRMVFSGFLAPGGTAHFVVYVSQIFPPTTATITLRQLAVALTNAPALTPVSLVLLALLLGGFAAFRLRRPKSGRSSL